MCCCLLSLPVDLLNIVLYSEPQVYTQVLCIDLLGGGLKKFSAVLEGGPKFLHKSERGDENSIKYLRMSSTPSPARINDRPLKAVLHLQLFWSATSVLACVHAMLLENLRTRQACRSPTKITKVEVGRRNQKADLFANKGSSI